MPWERPGLLSGNEHHDLRVISRLWHHYNLVGA